MVTLVPWPHLEVFADRPSTWNQRVRVASARDGSAIVALQNWIFWSNLTILFNKWILESTPFPILLTSWHLFFATLATQLLFRTSILANPRSIKMTPTLYMAKIAPIGLLYSGSLVCSNMAYIYLNVGFIQMLKASGPVITLLISALYGVTELTAAKLVNVAVITASVGLTVVSEIQFSWVGVVVQLVSLVLTSSSSSLSSSPTLGTHNAETDEEPGKLGIDTLHETIPKDEEQASTSKNTAREQNQSLRLTNMDPLLSLYYTAPICAVMNGILAWRTEILPLLLDQIDPSSPSASEAAPAGLLGIILSTGLGTLFLNAVVGFMLNVAVFTLVHRQNLCVSLLQAVGYAGALGGLVVYAGGGGYIRRGFRGSVVWARKGVVRYGYGGLGLGADGDQEQKDRVKPK
ncbi:hypothetical protein BDW60DRAFT_218436 [Aspergillus nidulans var. acristatus]